MVTIQEYVAKQLKTLESIELANKLGVSLSMISAYKKSYNPSLKVAKIVFKEDGIVLHPFSKESLEYEVEQ